MKRIFTFISVFAFTLLASAQADETLQFVDKDGNVIPDGTVLRINAAAQDDGFGETMIEANPGLYVKNTGGSTTGCDIQLTIEKIDNGALQLCFPVNCAQYSEADTYTTPQGSLASQEVRNLLTEWLPTAYGEAKAVYQIRKYKVSPFGNQYTFEANGPQVTVLFSYKEAAPRQIWWGYVTGDATCYGLGVQNADTYHCAIYIPGNEATVSGKTINAVRFRLLSITNVSDVKVWLSTTLPVSADKADVAVVNVSSSELKTGINEVALPTPCKLGKKGLYVGYSFTINTISGDDDKYPIAITPDEDMQNALIIKTDNAVPDWSDMNGYGFGRLFLQVLLDGEFSQNSAVPGSIDDCVAALNGSAEAVLPVTNLGLLPITSINFVITTDGVAGTEQHLDLLSPIDFGLTGTCSFIVPADAENGLKKKTLTITKVNDCPNEASSPAVVFNYYTLAKMVAHRVAVEEFTGTACGWCPRGLVGMDKLRDTFGDQFIGIGLHQYNSSDAMYISPSKYAALNFTGAPGCTLERRYYTDPYYGSGKSILDDFSKLQATPTMVGVEVEGFWNEDNTQVNAKATVESLVDDVSYNIEYVLIADGLTGTTSAWKQSNYYYQYNTSELPEDLAIFANGGRYGKSTFQWTFNDVALCSSYSNSVNMAAPIENLSSTSKAVSKFTLTMPTKSTLLNAINKDEVYVIALIINPSTGYIVNAAKSKVKPYTAGIKNVGSVESNEVKARYTLDGRKMSAPHKGLNIMKMSDGTIRKVMVK